MDVSAPSIGKGFQGAMKRWGFKGGRASHGASLSHRSLGSTGMRQDPGRVFKGKKMAGRMGGNDATVQNLKVSSSTNCQVIKVDTELDLIYVRGAVPGHDHQFVRVQDAIKKRSRNLIFPKETVAPFPTFMKEVHGEAPREQTAVMGGIDPFVPPKD